MDTDVSGKCCACGYSGEEETPCHHSPDGNHCEHWWDGPTDEDDQEES
jgi:hypothetical protein